VRPERSACESTKRIVGHRILCGDDHEVDVARMSPGCRQRAPYRTRRWNRVLAAERQSLALRAGTPELDDAGDHTRAIRSPAKTLRRLKGARASPS
jgi:hypothetical protein